MYHNKLRKLLEIKLALIEFESSIIISAIWVIVVMEKQKLNDKT